MALCLTKNVINMKNLFLVFMLVGVTAFANEGEPLQRPDGVTVEKVQENLTKEEALYCKVEWPDGTTFSCWLCDCKDLPRAMVEIEE